MLRALLALALAAAPGLAQLPTSPDVRRTDLDAAALSSLRTTDGATTTLALPAPGPVRSIGLWYAGPLGDVTATLLAGGRELATWPLAEDHDQAPERFDAAALAARPAGHRRVTGLAHTYDGPADGLVLTWTGPAAPEALTVVWLGAFAEPVEPPRPLPPGGGEPAGGSKSGAEAPYPEPAVYARASWGAAAPSCSSPYCTTTHLAVHHTASSSDYAASTWGQAAANVKAVQTYHMVTNGWCDIGYNYLVTRQGWIFEGRAGGDDVKGAHDGFNCGSMGVSAMGYFHTPVNNPTTPALLDALAELGAWKFDQQGITPFGSSWYAGYGGTMTNVYGHRDVKATACPGDLLYAQLGTLRQGIADRLAGTPAGGTLKGVLYDASVGTSKRVQGTVALADGTFVHTGTDGYYEFPLSAGTYSFGGTAPGHAPGAATETVASGDVWESVGLWPSSSVPAHTDTDVGVNLFNATFQGDPGSPVWLAYSGAPGLPLTPFAGAGTLWVDLPSAQVLFLGSVPASGTLSVNLSVSGAPAGMTLHTQAYLLWQGQARVTNGSAWIAP